MNSQKTAESAHITYRQLDTWVRMGWLKPSGGTGQGVPRDFPQPEVEKAKAMGRLTHAGVAAKTAAHIVVFKDRDKLDRLRRAIASVEPFQIVVHDE